MTRTMFTTVTEQERWFDPQSADSWEEETFWDGNNHISKATGSQWDHQTLYRTAKQHLWVLLSYSQWQGSRDTYQEITASEAYHWLLRNGYDAEVPEEFLAELEA